MNIFLNARQKVVIAVSALVIVGSIAFVALAPRAVPVAESPVPPVPTSSPSATPIAPEASPTPDFNQEYERIDGVKANAAVDMAMALVAQVAAIDFRQSPEQVIQSIRPMASSPVMDQVAERLQSMDWDDIQKRQYWLHAEVVATESFIIEGSGSKVPSMVRVTVDLFDVPVSGDLKPAGSQVWEVGVGQGEGKNGWLATSLKKIG